MTVAFFLGCFVHIALYGSHMGFCVPTKTHVQMCYTRLLGDGNDDRNNHLAAAAVAWFADNMTPYVGKTGEWSRDKPLLHPRPWRYNIGDGSPASSSSSSSSRSRSRSSSGINSKKID